jgi:hypothetical protein
MKIERGKKINWTYVFIDLYSYIFILSLLACIEDEKNLKHFFSTLLFSSFRSKASPPHWRWNYQIEINAPISQSSACLLFITHRVRPKTVRDPSQKTSMSSVNLYRFSGDEFKNKKWTEMKQNSSCTSWIWMQKSVWHNLPGDFNRLGSWKWSNIINTTNLLQYLSVGFVVVGFTNTYDMKILKPVMNIVQIKNVVLV